MLLTSFNARERVPKSHGRIALRGKLDSLNAQIIFFQASSSNKSFIQDLEEIRKIITLIQKSEAREEIFPGNLFLWGLNEEEIHKRSHSPEKFYGLGHVLPCFEMGQEAAAINLLRTQVREAELCACRAFNDEDPFKIIHVLNRLSSALYILIYKYLPKGFNKTFKLGRS